MIAVNGFLTRIPRIEQLKYTDNFEIRVLEIGPNGELGWATLYAEIENLAFLASFARGQK